MHETPEMKEMARRAAAPQAMPEAPIDTSSIEQSLDDLLNNVE